MKSKHLLGSLVLFTAILGVSVPALSKDVSVPVVGNDYMNFDAGATFSGLNTIYTVPPTKIFVIEHLSVGATYSTGGLVAVNVRCYLHDNQNYARFLVETKATLGYNISYATQPVRMYCGPGNGRCLEERC